MRSILSMMMNKGPRSLEETLDWSLTLKSHLQMWECLSATWMFLQIPDLLVTWLVSINNLFASTSTFLISSLKNSFLKATDIVRCNKKRRCSLFDRLTVFLFLSKPTWPGSQRERRMCGRFFILRRTFYIYCYSVGYA